MKTTYILDPFQQSEDVTIDITKLFIKPTAHNSSIQASDKLLPI